MRSSLVHAASSALALRTQSSAKKSMMNVKERENRGHLKKFVNFSASQMFPLKYFKKINELNRSRQKWWDFITCHEQTSPAVSGLTRVSSRRRVSSPSTDAQPLGDSWKNAPEQWDVSSHSWWF